ncbi:hypothetical protein PC129_g13981 [Phytophthora cactorum]|uniref:Uncharacterized protein n=1 Tax=Phytophthora cactorum TaxID=29920 RepID=A0A8T1FHK6_9STRA|nr:hypothetical protein PC111_g15614 [Phytophthora cactorum]KAG2811474.1 hypothetical protein PC112_g15587 [Phytophthora cactorum]KAG2851700.1 hypothetical protein PC113_g15685 [Phytophthora cactorum]KAG2890773.1 hypothetical protein PC114_g17293 [Phytophthora cactorum]KAG2903962.1 hypothetical protein PC115_g15143 [Phytophthora cactorum]
MALHSIFVLHQCRGDPQLFSIWLSIQYFRLRNTHELQGLRRRYDMMDYSKNNALPKVEGMTRLGDLADALLCLSNVASLACSQDVFLVVDKSRLFGGHIGSQPKHVRRSRFMRTHSLD